MPINGPLQNKRIIITRPAHQNMNLHDRLTALGAITTLLPLITIEQKTITISPATIRKGAVIIFTSANAVNCSHEFWINTTQEKTLIAIGPATKQALIKHSLPLAILPKAFNSEGLLALNLLQPPISNTIFICCGESPRQLLHDTLVQRCANLTVIECYRRKPTHPDERQLSALLDPPADLLIITSKSALVHWNQLIETTASSALLQIPLLTISPQLKMFAIKLGFNPVFVADNPTDEAICSSLLKYNFV